MEITGEGDGSGARFIQIVHIVVAASAAITIALASGIRNGPEPSSADTDRPGFADGGA